MHFRVSRLLTLVFLSLLSKSVCSQHASSELKGIEGWCLVPRLGYTNQGSSNFIEPGFGYMYVLGMGDTPFIVIGPYASVDLGPRKNGFLFGPKLGIEGTYFLVTGKLYGAWYSNGTQSDSRITPEIGLTLFGFITCCYGYNFKLQKTSTDLVSPHKITVGLNWFIETRHGKH
jgi:hypothetical protein